MDPIEEDNEDVEILGPIIIEPEDEATPEPKPEPKPEVPDHAPEPVRKKLELVDISSCNALLHQYFVQGEYIECKSLIGEISERFQGKCEYAFYIRGCIARIEGNLHEALEFLEKANEATGQGNENKYLVDMARINFLLGRHMIALEHLDVAMKTSPQNSKCYYWLAKCLYHVSGTKKYDPIESARKILLEAPMLTSDAQLLIFLGKLNEELGHSDEAVRSYQRAIELQPENTEFLMKLAMLYLRRNDEDSAFGILGRILALEPTNAESILAMGSIIQNHGDHDVALNKYRIAATVCDYNGCLWNNIGVGLLGRDKRAAAHSSLKKASFLSPLDYKVDYNLGVLHEFMGLHCSSLFHFKKAADLARDDARVIGATAVSLTNFRDFANARRAYLRSLELKPIPSVLLNYALFEFKQGNVEESAKQLEKFKEMKVKHPEQQAIAALLSNSLGASSIDIKD